jgi:SAM-dependent methyltransferase
VTFISPREYYQGLMRDLYPGGLAGRSVLDCACNCGGYLFWSKELGAGRCFGFDVRSHWIDQAEFLRRHRLGPGDVELAVSDLYDVPKLGLEPFDVTIFKGILYHLPDPVTGLKIAADLTREVMIVNTALGSGPRNMLVAPRRATNTSWRACTGSRGSRRVRPSSARCSRGAASPTPA